VFGKDAISSNQHCGYAETSFVKYSKHVTFVKFLTT